MVSFMGTIWNEYRREIIKIDLVKLLQLKILIFLNKVICFHSIISRSYQKWDSILLESCYVTWMYRVCYCRALALMFQSSKCLFSPPLFFISINLADVFVKNTFVFFLSDFINFHQFFNLIFIISNYCFPFIFVACFCYLL